MTKKSSWKRKVSILLSLAVLLTTLVLPQSTALAADFNYGEALQKAIMFYEFQRAGDLPENGRNNWRGDSAMTDGADNGLDLTGGWYDAGDHVKFNLPMAYTATMLCWSVYESRDAYVKSGQLPYILDNIKWATDYFIKCHPSPNVYYYQVGDGADDHAWWGPAEVMQMARPSFKVDTANPGSAVVGETAAALASAAAIFKSTDPTYAATCLKHAKELFTLADTTRSDKGYTAATGFYQSWSGFYDELTWAAIWIYIASNDETYLAKAESYEPNWERERGQTTIKYTWGHCWDSKLYGSLLMLAKLTGKQLYKECTERNLDWWTTGTNGNRIAYTPKGLAWLDMWGSLRYATTQAFLASVYADWSGCDPAKVTTYQSFAKSQIDYALGSTGRSYVVGFGVNPPKHPHHRTAHSSWMGYLTANIPDYNRHVLYGALAGGPGKSDDYTDDINNYTNNEVACDYNAGFVGILAKMYGKYGGTPIPNFTAIETPEDEFVSVAKISPSGSQLQMMVSIRNQSGWPARVCDKLSARYFLDITEGGGVKPADIKASSSATGVKISALTPWDPDKNIYYFEIDLTGTKLFPGGINDYKRDIYMSISAPYGTAMDWNNDFSSKGLGAAGTDGTATKNIPIYNAGVKLSGEEPPRGNVTPTPTSPLPTPTSTPTSPSNGYTISGYVKPSFSYSEAATSTILSGFKVEVEGTKITASTGANGLFELKNVPKNASGYTLKITKTNYLTRKIKTNAVAGDISVSGVTSPIDMWAGDMLIENTQDGAINMSDVMQIAKYFNMTASSSTFDALVDLNKDGAVNMSDIMIVASHFNKTSLDY